MSKKRLTSMCHFCETEERAKKLCEYYNSRASYYIKKRYPAHYTPWNSKCLYEKMHFVVWYTI